MRIMVAPNGVALPEDAQAQTRNAPLLWSLAGVAGNFVRATTQITQPVEIDVKVVRADDVAIVWAFGPWVMHASDLRAGTIAQFCEMVRRSRAKSAMTPANPPNVVIPRYVMSLIARDEKIPAGIIVQHTTNPPPLPMLEVRMSAQTGAMWMTSVYLNIVARIGEPALKAALAEVATIRARTADIGGLLDLLPAAMKRHSLVDEEFIACIELEAWEKKGGVAGLAELYAMVPR